MRAAAIAVLAAVVIGAHVAEAIEYKKSVISGPGGGSMRTTFHSTSSSTTIGGSNVTVRSQSSPHAFQFRNFNWPEHTGNLTLEQRIRDAEQKLHKLYFMHDVCRTLEDEITIAFEQKDIREVLAQVAEVKKVDLPFEVPDGSFVVEKSDVSGMRMDEFLSSVAAVCGLVLKYEPTKLVFVKSEDD